MRIAYDSPSGQRLAQHGVERRELEATRIYGFDFQLGAAITLPIPFMGTSIFLRRKWLVYDEEGELKDSWDLAILRHELRHVCQILDWGGVVYMARQLWARVKTRSLYARESPEESHCYEAEARVYEFYRSRSDG